MMEICIKGDLWVKIVSNVNSVFYTMVFFIVSIVFVELKSIFRLESDVELLFVYALEKKKSNIILCKKTNKITTGVMIKGKIQKKRKINIFFTMDIFL